ncbi:MAG: HAD family phosphatase [Muribaculaceae bacterium]|nr:HAD family phosphatase [Muribaculaceae bacterium]
MKRICQYKNLLFDLGGVVMDLDRSKCVDAFKALGLTIADELLGLYVQDGPFLKLEEGEITPDDFRAELRRHISSTVSDKQLDDAFNQFLLGIPKHRLESLRNLRKNYKIYLLSNTNSIMFESKIKDCFAIEGLNIESYFDGMITSYEARCAKPGKEIFEYTISHLNIKPEETLFFDDSQKNLDTASEFGFGTQIIEPGKEFADYL